VVQASVRFLGKALLVAVPLTVAGATLVGRLVGGPARDAVWMAGAVALVGAAAGRLPRLFLRRSSPDYAVTAAMSAVLGRMLVTAGLGLAVTATELVPPLPFAAALVVLYAALLFVEVREAVAEVQRATMPAERAGAATR
jgi:hypothetical protein